MRSFFRFLRRRSDGFIMAVCLIIGAVIGAVHYLTGSEVSVSILYLFPVSVSAWYLGRHKGLVVSAVCAVIWFVADHLTGYGYSHPLIPYWNALVVFGTSALLVHALNMVVEARAMQEQLSQFIVHDLRSPLTNVLTGMQTLKAISGDEVESDQKVLTDMAIIGSERLLGLINSLLDVPRMEAGQMPVKREPVDTRSVVEEAFTQVRMWATENSVALESHVDESAVEVLADSPLTTRILTNLISNALKFSPSGSTITVRVEKTADKVATFCVKDQGPGIPAQWAKKVFDKFAQVEARQRGVAVGTGLGLTFCKLAVDAQGGRIWLESAEGQGTTFKFTLPMAG